MKISGKKFSLYILDLLLFLSAGIVHFSSYVIWFIVPRGVGLHGNTYCSGNGLGPTGNCVNFLGMVRYSWIKFHNWAAVAFVVILLIHIVLHWGWIIATTRRIRAHYSRSAVRVLELYGAFAFLVALFLFECSSGLVLWLVLPRGMRDYDRMAQGFGRTFLGLQRNNWVDLHAWVAVIIVSILIVHLILNWNFVVGAVKKAFRRGRISEPS